MKEERIADSSFHEESDHDEVSLRPLVLADFVGQEKLKENLSVFIQAAKKRKESLDHLFFSGPPGLGKTTLAGIIAHELGVELRATAAPALDKPGDLAAILTSIGRHNVFFIDEIHRLKPVIEEMLYTAMEDKEIDVVIGQGPGARSIKIPLEPFTLVGATTRPGLVSRPLHDRFGIRARLDYYENRDIVNIIHRSSGILSAELDDAAAAMIATSSRGTPRVANRLLRRMRDYSQVWGNGKISVEIVKRGLSSLEIDPEGLDKLDREILKAIVEKYDGGPVGCETLAIYVGESTDTIEDVYEPYLIQRGFIMRTPRGRVATKSAYLHLGLPAKNEDERLLF
ncbi:MAG: Holliday junction branch migration DNA helicase RuvB [Spirochaetaceae bacterium]|nr:MAG: Holliday junction branch migration DNA helicase RuvB [Spirochaetaceae bacterium]